jgi:hypothetical protein
MFMGRLAGIMVIIQFFGGGLMMVTKARLIIVSSLIILALLLGYLALPLITAQAKPRDWVGSWNAQITVVKQGANFPGFMTFFEDGNLLADESPSPLETSGHGAWTKTGDKQAAYSFGALIGDAAPNVYTRILVKGTLTYNAKNDTWQGPFTIRMVNQDGVELFADTGTMTATRITAQP